MKKIESSWNLLILGAGFVIKHQSFEFTGSWNYICLMIVLYLFGLNFVVWVFRDGIALYKQSIYSREMWKCNLMFWIWYCRLWQDAENRVYLTKELDRITGQVIKRFLYYLKLICWRLLIFSYHMHLSILFVQ